MGSEPCSQNFDMAKFHKIISRNPCYEAFFLGTWPQNSEKTESQAKPKLGSELWPDS